MEMNGHAKQRGFTLIELVVVITILGILAAFAVPRFARLDTQAREASRAALAGSVRAGAALSHALWLAGGQPASVNMEGQAVAMTFGYPSRASIGLTLAQNTVSGSSGYTYTPATGVFLVQGGASTCTFTYTGATAANTSPTIAIGGVC
jgi:MSHA pilin protein MshA